MSFASEKEIALAIVDYMLAKNHRVIGSGLDDDQRYGRVKQKYTEFSDEQRDNNWLIYGDVQSGKSSEMTAQTGISVAFGQRVVVVVRNSLMDSKQFVDNLRATSNDIRNYLQDKFRERFDANNKHARYLIHPTVRDSDGIRQDIEESGHFFIDNRNTNVLVVLANDIGIRSVGDGLRGDRYKDTDDIREESRVNIIVDEYDVLSQQVAVEVRGKKKKGSTYTKLEWNDLYRISTLTFHVTATPLAAMAEDNGARLNVANTIIVQPHTDYRGVNTLQHVSLEAELNLPENLDVALKQLLVGDKKLRKTGCPGLLDTINKLSEREVYSDHPTILLAKCKTDIADHETMCKVVHTTNPGMWATISFNGTGVIMESHTLPDEALSGESVRYQIGDRPATVGIKTKTITRRYTLKCGIKEALQILKTVTRSGSDGAPKRIFIAAGILADRGLNFVSEDYQWHITDEFLHMPSSACSDRMVQGLRILGRHTIRTPLLIWCNAQIWETIKKYQGVVKTYLDESQNQTDTWGDRFKQVIYHEQQLPNRPHKKPRGADMARMRRGDGANVDEAVFNSYTEQLSSSTQPMGVDRSIPINIVQESMDMFKSLWSESHTNQHLTLVKHLLALENSGQEGKMSKRDIEQLLECKFEGKVRDRFTRWYSTFDGKKRKIDHSRNNYRILCPSGTVDSFILSTDVKRLIKEVEDKKAGKGKDEI